MKSTNKRSLMSSCFMMPILAITLSAALFPVGVKYINAKNNEANELIDTSLNIQMQSLDKINYLPSFLPLIIENADVIELDDDQLATLINWRTEYREAVIADMNEIVSLRVALKQAAVLPETSTEQIVSLQDEIFLLQRNVLQYKLHCRDLVIDTFNQNNWEGFMMVLADEGYAVELPEFQQVAVN